ncbi:YfiR family protein [Beggiatoa leptomitoformis]|uniref:YfiR family protein n=1 Tax=Beggiatoa leptomitoformis TaxID=288004 RepID=UPI000705AD04|nr:YfiR family protein [Beggiatoa leptomitoformis]
MISKLSFQLQLLFFLLGSCLPYACFATPTVATEYQVKAAFLYNFANFISWPSTAFTDSTQTFQVCIFGTDPFEEVLDNLLKNQNAKDRKIKAVRLLNTATINNCHILFIGQSAQIQLEDLLALLDSYSVLTVSDIPDFVLRGGMIEFFTVDNKIRLAINPDKLEAAGMKADANLLRLSKIMRPLRD